MGTLPASKADRRRQVLIGFSLIALNVAVYWQTTQFDFAFDDRYYVSENDRVLAGLSVDNVMWALTTTYFVNWHPLTWLSFMADAEISGSEPGGFHLTNLLWHAANTLLLYAVLQQMTAATWKSAFVAALFAVHPLHVESVAWISGRKDIISTFFALLAIGSYARYCRRLEVRWYSAALTAFVLSLCAKQMWVTLPFLLLLLDYWPLGRLSIDRLRAIAPERADDGPRPGETTMPLRNSRSNRRISGGACDDATAGDMNSVHNLVATHGGGSAAESTQTTCVPLPWGRLLVEKVPFLAIAAVFCVVVIAAQKGGDAIRSLDDFSLAARLANALLAYVLYIKMMLWPQHLAVFYPHPGDAISWPSVATAAIVLAVLTAAVVASARQRSYLVVGWFWYVGTLVPVIGLVQVGDQQMADRYTYVPLIGLFVAIVWLVPSALPKTMRQPELLSAAAVLILLVLTAAAWRQTGYWRNNVSLFERALAVTENNKVAHSNLGFALEQQGRTAEALEHYERALRIDPDDAFTHFFLGSLLLRVSRFDEAVRHCQKAVRLMPAFQTAQCNLGVALEKLGRFDEAAIHYRLAADLSDAQYNLAVVLDRQGRLDEAIAHYRQAIRIHPRFAEAHYNLANDLAQQGRLAQAARNYREALTINPNFAAAHYNLSCALKEQGDIAKAVEHCRKSLEVEPHNPLAHNHLGLLYLTDPGREKTAIEHFRKAIVLAPDYSEAAENLRRALARDSEMSPPGFPGSGEP